MKGLACIFIIIALLGGACKDEKSFVNLQLGHKNISVEIANTDELRSQGLMYRKTLAQDSGMLFVFREEKKLSFWMKNTLIPLSIAYISKTGEIKEIHDLKPFDERTVRSSHFVLYALEMNRGWFRENDVKEGDRIIIPENL